MITQSQDRTPFYHLDEKIQRTYRLTYNRKILNIQIVTTNKIGSKWTYLWNSFMSVNRTCREVGVPIRLRKYFYEPSRILLKSI